MAGAGSEAGRRSLQNNRQPGHAYFEAQGTPRRSFDQKTTNPLSVQTAVKGAGSLRLAGEGLFATRRETRPQTSTLVRPTVYTFATKRGVVVAALASPRRAPLYPSSSPSAPLVVGAGSSRQQPSHLLLSIQSHAPTIYSSHCCLLPYQPLSTPALVFLSPSSRPPLGVVSSSSARH